MKSRSISITRLLLLAFVLLCPQHAQQALALTLTGSITPTVTTVISPCSGNPGYSYVTTATSATIVSTGQQSNFTAAWNTVLTSEWDPTGWTLNFSDTPVVAELNISTYHAYDDSLSTGLGGAEFQLDWTPTAEQSNLKWIQAIHTNRPKKSGAEWYLDVMRLKKELPPVYPFSYSDYRFYDKPGRYYEPGESIYWDAYLYLASVDRNAKSVTVYQGVNWGFTIDCVTVPEPGCICVVIVGLSGLLIRKRTGA